MRAEIKALSQQLRTTMVFVTHDQVEAMTMADRIVIMKSGIIQQVGSPEDVYERPANLFVAGFIGSPAMNVLPVTVADDRLVLSDGRSVLIANPGRKRPAALTEGATVDLEVAPHDPNAIAVTVELVEPLGSDTLIHFKLAEVDAIARVSPDLRPKPGDRLSLSPIAGKAHLFQRETGEIIG